MTRSLVIDQGTRISGFCIVQDCEGCVVTDENRDEHQISPGFPGHRISDGLLKMGGTSLVSRLDIFECDVIELIRAFRPDEIVVEDTSWKQRNAKTSEAMGALMVRCKAIAEKSKLPLYKQHPGTIKAQLTGNGKADKDQVKEVTAMLYRIPIFKLKDDNHADAMGAALVWLMRAPGVR